MARPQKSRIVASIPNSDGLIPTTYSLNSNCKKIVLTVDEYEAIRLIDYSGLTQEECAKSMEVSRPTITKIYESARYKLADGLVNEKPILIGGGNFIISEYTTKVAKLKEDITMKIAVTYQNGEIFQHFGHCESFKIYTVEDSKVINEEVIDATGSGHGALAGFLKDAGADALICGGIGGGAKNALAEAKIQLYGGVTGSADEAVKALISGTLEYNENITCNHHGHEHGKEHTCGHHGHGEGHTCGHHGHGEGHTCGHHGHGEDHTCGNHKN